MQVLLKENVEHLGNTGELLDVRPGYARNYLVPKGLAINVTRKNIKSIEKEIERFKLSEKKKQSEIESMAKKLAEVNCTIAVQSDDDDKLFGSVSVEDIAKAVCLAGIEIQPKQVKLPRQIKSIGVFDAKVHFDMGVVGDLKVWVVKE